MGGLGSGRWFRRETRLTVEECRNIDINTWSRNDRELGHPWSWEWPNDSPIISTIYVNREPQGLWVRYDYGFDPENRAKVAYLIPIEYTSTGFGKRPWFLCPRCSRRSGKLYLYPGYHRLICRVCANLSYSSQNQ